MKRMLVKTENRESKIENERKKGMRVRKTIRSTSSHVPTSKEKKWKATLMVSNDRKSTRFAKLTSNNCLLFCRKQLIQRENNATKEKTNDLGEI